jgi:hypothetical protein
MCCFLPSPSLPSGAGNQLWPRLICSQLLLCRYCSGERVEPCINWSISLISVQIVWSCGSTISDVRPTLCINWCIWLIYDVVYIILSMWGACTILQYNPEFHILQSQFRLMYLYLPILLRSSKWPTCYYFLLHSLWASWPSWCLD